MADSEVDDRIDTAYRTKCSRFGGAYVNPVVAVRSTTLRLVPPLNTTMPMEAAAPPPASVPAQE
ncbi:hypothetical protein ACKI1Q_41070 [Streptomyces galilaeus]|uniref:hypothetical protein n=1 Tax=Streptomyces galilaeus TaxID=33899 RepID=UPI0038F6F8C0